MIYDIFNNFLSLFSYLDYFDFKKIRADIFLLFICVFAYVFPCFGFCRKSDATFWNIPVSIFLIRHNLRPLSINHADSYCVSVLHRTNLYQMLCGLFHHFGWLFPLHIRCCMDKLIQDDCVLLCVLALCLPPFLNFGYKNSTLSDDGCLF